MKKVQHDTKPQVKSVIERTREFLRDHEVKTILEVGSRDAEVSLHLKKKYRNAKVYAFECNPDGIALCRKNIGKTPGVELVEIAVSDTVGTLDFYSIDPSKTQTMLADGNIGASSLYKANPDYPSEKYVQRKITVPSTTLEKWGKENNVTAVDLLWLDVQGAELRVLKGMGELIKTVKVIYTEVEFRPVYLGQPLFDELHRFLIENGFFLYRLEGWKWHGDATYLNMNLKRLPKKRFFPWSR